MYIPLLFFASLMFLGDKVVGDYTDYAGTRKAFVRVWEGQEAAVTDVAKSHHFTVERKGDNILLVTFTKEKDLLFHLKKLGEDAGIDNILPYPPLQGSNNNVPVH